MLIDSHCHLNPRGYKEKNLDQILLEAKENDVDIYVTIGTDDHSNEEAIDLAREHEDIYCAIGIYPHEELNKSIQEMEHILRLQLKKSHKIIGIGECGIDVTEWQGGRPVKDQIEVFDMQVTLALEHNLPLIIHNRNGDEYVLRILTEYKNRFKTGLNNEHKLKGVAHCFASSWETAQKFLDLGFYISFSGLITYPSRKELLETVKNVPLDRFVFETDSPYLPPQGHRGEINEPKYVKMVAQKFALARGISFDDTALLSRQNTLRLFDMMTLPD